MKRIIALALVVAVTGCATYRPMEDWTKGQKILGGTSVALDVVDYVTTKECLSMPNCHESNKYLGEHPSNKKLAIFKAVTSVGKLGLADGIPKVTNYLGVQESPMRTGMLLLFNFIQFKTNAKNAQIIGWKFGF